MRNIILTAFISLSTLAYAQSEIYLKELTEDQIAIVNAENDQTLFIETKDSDKEILGYAADFYTVYRTSTNKVYVKSPDGKVISGLAVPPHCYVEATDFANMTDHERFHAKSTKIAFTIVNVDTAERFTYNKYCKFIGN